MTPFERAVYPPAFDIDLVAKQFGISRKEAQRAVAELQTHAVFKNDQYQVALRRWVSTEGGPDMIQLSVKRLDREPLHDWRDLQRIKNELTDPEYEGVELYPAESRRVDSANETHLFVACATDFRFTP